MRQLLITGTSCAFLAVALGAFAAHGLKAHLTAYQLNIWNTAVDYQMAHALGIMLIALIANQFNLAITKAGWLMFTGILLFSGSLYLLSLTGIKTLGMITPLGGLCFLIAWGWLALSIWRQPESTDNN